jgi:hypothetical protein
MYKHNIHGVRIFIYCIHKNVIHDFFFDCYHVFNYGAVSAFHTASLVGSRVNIGTDMYIYIYIFAREFVFYVTCYATRYYNPGHDRAVYCVGDVRVVAKLVSFGPSCFCLFLTSLRYCRVAMALEGIVLLPYGTCLGNHVVQEATAATPAPRAVVQAGMFNRGITI